MDVASSIAKYDAMDLAARVGALQVTPENADHLARLEAASAVIASLDPGLRKAPQISTERLRDWLNHDPFLTSVRPYEDPFTDPFTESMTCFGGSFVVFPGIMEDATFILRHIIEAVFRCPFGFSNREYAENARSLCRSVFVLSDTIASRANMPRGTSPIQSADENFRLPPGRRLQELKAAVSFSHSELKIILREHDLAVSKISPLVIELGEVDLNNLNPLEPPTMKFPIVRHQEAYVVVAPANMLAALRYRLVKMAVDQGAQEELVLNYRWVVFRTLVQSLGHLGLHALPADLPDADFTALQNQLFGLDTDKVANVMLITDELEEYDSKTTFGRWDVASLQDKIDRRIRIIDEFVFGSQHPPNEVLHLVFLQGIGRGSAAGFTGPVEPAQCPRLALSATDVEFISFVESSTQLILWQYARAVDRAAETTNIVATDTLDKFQFFRRNRYGFYFSDETIPDLAVIPPGEAGALRQEVQAMCDRHGVEHFSKDGIIEVISAFSDSSVPIYFHPTAPGCEVLFALLVETGTLNAWIIASPSSDESAVAAPYADMIETIAYWLWQVSPSVSDAWRDLRLAVRTINIRVELHPEEDWTSHRNVDGQGELTELTIADDTLILRIGSGIKATLHSSNNSGERRILETLLDGLDEFAARVTNTPRQLSLERVQQIIDEHAPLGPKKKLLAYAENGQPVLVGERLPEYRKLQLAEEQIVLEEVGQLLRLREEISTGAIPRDDRTSVLRRVVGFLYDELVRIVATISPFGLLEWLVAHHESIIRSEAFQRLSMPATVACFGSVERMAEQLNERVPERAAAAGASRFLIEYVTAKPPSGLRPISLSLYDQMISVSAQLISFARTSDAIRYRLSDPQCQILGSGRLGIEKTDFDVAVEDYHEVRSLSEVFRSQEQFGRWWPEAESSSGDQELSEEMERATRCEFGLSLGELSDFAAEVIILGRDQEGEPKHALRNEFTDRIEHRLGWDSSRVACALDIFAASPREEFLNPPSPFALRDVEPWNHNRGLSYLRRPLLVRSVSGQDELIWGRRSVAQALQYLSSLCYGGALRGRSTEMTQLAGAIRNRIGERFNERVADYFRGVPDTVVRTRVKKIGSRRIASKSGAPLGDIDVLVVLPKEHRILAVEAKAMKPALTPSGLSNELAELFGKSEDNGGKLKNHTDRTEWLRRHVDEVLEWLHIAIDENDEWCVTPLVVSDTELISPFVARSPVRVIPFPQLRVEFPRENK